MMTNLLRSELLRLVSSRSFQAFLILTMLISCWPAITGANGLIPLTQEERDIVWQSHQEDLRYWQEAHDSRVQSCEAGEQWACEDLVEDAPPTLDDLHLLSVTSFQEQVTGSMESLGILMLFLVAVFVSLYLGSQFTSGTVATQLTFTPRRQQVLWAKVLSGVLASGLLGLVCQGVVLVVNVLTFMWVRGVGGMELSGDVGVQLLRYLVAAMLAGALFGILAALFASSWRGIVAVLLLFYLLQVLAGVSFSFRLPVVDRIQPVPYITAVIYGRFPSWYSTSRVEQSLSDVAVSTNRAEVVTFWGGLGYCLLVLAVLGLIVSWTFQRRDMRG